MPEMGRISRLVVSYHLANLLYKYQISVVFAPYPSAERGNITTVEIVLTQMTDEDGPIWTAECPGLRENGLLSMSQPKAKGVWKRQPMKWSGLPSSELLPSLDLRVFIPSQYGISSNYLRDTMSRFSPPPTRYGPVMWRYT
jgi:hypothetical protein